MSAVTSRREDLADVRRRVEAVLDPELPFVTLADLGVVRSIGWSEQTPGTVVVEITPTYTGCPAMEVIARDVEAAVAATGHAAEVRLVLAPAWTTDWITTEGRNALQQAGIAPPGPTHGPIRLTLGERPSGPIRPACPQCGSGQVEELARFGSTACKSLWRCLDCREPFDHMKPL